MSNFKGTKGKWTVLGVNQEYKWFNIDSKKKIIGRAFFGRLDPIVDEIEAKANALLMSKAPEMLEMLEEILFVLKRENGYNEMYKEVKKLIKEATEL